MNGLLEILTNKQWMINPDYVQGIRAMLQHNLTTHAALELPEKVMGYPVSADGSSRILADNGEYYKVEEPFINLEIINGPITRNGDACSYGSRDHRDMMMMAADSPYCVGHIFSINTPGGSAWAKNDYQQAIDYAHSKGQRVIAFVDGMCCSAGMYLAALCDERYYMHPKDEIGCIGVMAAFFSLADGEKVYTNETYHELYDPESFDKNKEMRDIANDGNDELLIADLAALGVEFRADVKKACPKATDEHLHGKVFDAADVDGILMDGQKNLAEVIALFDKDAKLVAKRTSQQATASARMMAGAAKENILSTQLNNVTEMKEKFPALFAALAVEEMQMTEEGAFLNTGLLETLNAAIEAKQQEGADAKALADQLTAEKAELEQKLETANGEHTAAIETLNTEHAAAIDALKADHAAAIEEKQNAIAALEQEKADLTADQTAKAEQIETLNGQLTEKQTALDGAQAALETAQQTLAERDQQITDLNAQIEELSNDAGHEPAAGASPQNNGEGAEQATVAVSQYVYDNNLSYDENMKAKKAWDAEHGVK